MAKVMTACVIMHNMIIADEHDDMLFDQTSSTPEIWLSPQPGLTSFQEFLRANHEIRDSTTHNALQRDLIDHMWAHVGNH